jgi:large subunit ribosomal protein L21
VKDKKLYVFKFKRRKNVRRKTGHRQKYTEIRITGVTVGG